MRLLDNEYRQIESAMCSMLLWLAPDEPADERLVYRILARGSRAYRDAAQTVFYYRLLHSEVLRRDLAKRLVWVPSHRVGGDDISVDPVDPTEMEIQRRIVGDVWNEGLHLHSSYCGLPWIYPHLIYYYTRSSQLEKPRRVTKPDMRLRLYTAEICAALGTLDQVQKQLAALEQDRALSPKLWDCQLGSQERYVAAQLALRVHAWDEARVALRTGYELYVTTVRIAR